jgi:DNA-binding HxlR family transcriptional regulator
MHAGVMGLSLLEVPLNVHALRTLSEGEASLSSVSAALGHPPASTLRSHLASLEDLGVVERRQEPGFPGSVSYALTTCGEGLLWVESTLRGWLQSAPSGSLQPATQAAKSATKALTGGWSSGIVRALAARPFALTELSRLIPQISYPTLERRLTAMRRVGLVEARNNGSGRGTPYAATDWLRHAVAPLTASMEWEQRHCAERAPALRRIDIEAPLLLVAPLLELDRGGSPVCRLAVELGTGAATDYAGVMVTMKEGRPAAWLSRLNGAADAWATGSLSDWLRWINGRDEARLEFGGDAAAAAALAESLRTEVALGAPSPS